MLAKIYVGNLPSSTSEADIRKLFAEHGTVHSCRLKTNGRTGECRGFGFVEMEYYEAKAAVDALDGSVFEDRNLRVASLVGC
jgi:RNA recognition motif-containing protein